MPFDGTQSTLSVYADILRNADESLRHSGFYMNESETKFCAIGMIAKTLQLPDEDFFYGTNNVVDRVFYSMPCALTELIALHNDKYNTPWADIADIIESYDQP